MAGRETGKFPAQIVVMSKQPLADAVRRQAGEDGESIAGIGRRWLEFGRRVQAAADASGYAAEVILDQVERTYAAATKA